MRALVNMRFFKNTANNATKKSPALKPTTSCK